WATRPRSRRWSGWKGEPAPPPRPRSSVRRSRATRRSGGSACGGRTPSSGGSCRSAASSGRWSRPSWCGRSPRWWTGPSRSTPPARGGPMPDPAAAQLARLLELIPALATGENHDLDELARRLGTDRATLLADIQALSQRYDDPGGFVEAVQIYLEAGNQISLTTAHFARPMRLTLGELAALELGLALLAVERAPDERPVIERARDRLREVIRKLPPDWAPDRLRYAELGGPAELRHLESLRRARRLTRRVRIAYRKPGAMEAENRVVCPYAVAFASGRWYLIAHCGASDGVRIFRLDGIGTVEQ